MSSYLLLCFNHVFLFAVGIIVFNNVGCKICEVFTIFHVIFLLPVSVMYFYLHWPLSLSDCKICEVFAKFDIICLLRIPAKHKYFICYAILFDRWRLPVSFIFIIINDTICQQFFQFNRLYDVVFKTIWFILVSVLILSPNRIRGIKFYKMIKSTIPILPFPTECDNFGLKVSTARDICWLITDILRRRIKISYKLVSPVMKAFGIKIRSIYDLF